MRKIIEWEGIRYDVTRMTRYYEYGSGKPETFLIMVHFWGYSETECSCHVAAFLTDKEAFQMLKKIDKFFGDDTAFILNMTDALLVYREQAKEREERV